MYCWLIAGSLIVFSALVTHTVGQYGSQCILPNQREGSCMPVQSCKSVYEIFVKAHASGGQISEENRKLFSQRHCGSFKNVPHVCCAESDIQLNPDGLAILKNQSCGWYDTHKVSNGNEAALFGFPWMALLVYNDTRRAFKCAGSIISEQYILTAAHCIVNKDDLLHVRLGEHNISSEVDCTAGGRICAPPVENIEIEETIVHDGYKQFLHDIALIRLKRKIQYQIHIKPLCLPIYDNLKGKTHSEYIISGWGRTEKELAANVLMVALVPHVTRSACQTKLREHRLRIPLTESVICAGNTNLVDVCDGDSGGPMGYKDMYDGKPKFVQFAVVSFGVNLCGEGDAPNAYTNVSHYMQWITDNIRQ